MVDFMKIENLENKHKELFRWKPKREEFGCTTDQYHLALKESLKTNVNIYKALEKLFGITYDSMHGRNGRVIFKINIIEYMRKDFENNSNLSSEEINNILNEIKSFEVTYTLTRNGCLERYEIKDSYGNKHNFDEYNSYERSIFGSCYDYFSHCLFYMEKPKELPSGVINAIFEME